MQWDWHGLWIFAKWSVSALGGFAGVTKIFEWLFSGPKIYGEIEWVMVGDERFADGSNRGAVVALVYLVNRRIKPTTIRGFNARVQIDGKWIEGDTSAIPDGFVVVGQPKIDFAGNRLYDRAASNLLEYGKGLRGWLRFSFPGTQPKDITNNALLHIRMVDAFGHKHFAKKFRLQLGKGVHDQGRYFTGSGVSQNN